MKLLVWPLLTVVLASCNSPDAASTTTVAAAELVRGTRRVAMVRPDSVTVVYVPEARQFVAWTPRAVEAWRFLLPGEEALAGDPAVAANSYMYARTGSALFAFSPHGEILWRKEINASPVPKPALDLATTSDSGVLLAVDERTIVSFSPEGKEKWRIELPAGAVLRAPPVAAPNGAVIVSTDTAAHCYNDSGILLWERLFAPNQPAAAIKP